MRRLGARRVADSVGLSTSQVSGYLNRDRLPEAASLRRVAERTGVRFEFVAVLDPRWQVDDAAILEDAARREVAGVLETEKALHALVAAWQTADDVGLHDIIGATP